MLAQFRYFLRGKISNECSARQIVANTTGGNLGGDLVLVPVDIAPDLTGHTPPALLPPSRGSASSSPPAPAHSGERYMREYVYYKANTHDVGCHQQSYARCSAAV